MIFHYLSFVNILLSLYLSTHKSPHLIYQFGSNDKTLSNPPAGGLVFYFLVLPKPWRRRIPQCGSSSARWTGEPKDDMMVINFDNEKVHMAREKLVTEAEFSIPKGKSLVINISSDIGLDRIIIENRGNTVRVRANGHSHFEFADKPQEPGMCDFWLGNSSMTTTLKDYLEGRFWGQFTFGQLAQHTRNKKLKRLLRAEIKRLSDEFESKVAQKLSDILKNKS